LNLLEKNSSPLDSRPYKIRKPQTMFFCPLCSTQRALRYSARLNQRQYIQVLITSLVLMMGFFPLMGERVFFWPLVVWGVMEGMNKLMFRKEVPCPHCGFDATWYKKDVRVAKRLVKEFWQRRDAPPPEEIQEQLHT
jgi:predicted RNA-binding Zn-ribbon protein involved in translation (DUF1610 family)